LTKWLSVAIITIAKGDNGYSKMQNESPRSASFWGILVIYTADQTVGRVLRLCITSVQPLANVVADYACHYGDNKGDNILQDAHLLPAGKSRSLAIVADFQGNDKVDPCIG
jgi:hypothetical protein